ncbi:MAG: hypothetical protein AAF449_03990 [Myxococcota bacterium]
MTRNIMIGQLIAKEVNEHRPVAIGVIFLSIVQYVAFFELWLRHEPPTSLVAVSSFVWAIGPMIAAFTARRLFVLEQEQRTVQLLRSLPVSPWTITATKFGLGLVFNLVINLAILWASALYLKNQEIITTDWVMRLSIQVSVYIFAWYALACFHAHLGGYRFAVWLVFLVALTSFEDVVLDPSRNLFWTAALADDIETTRYATPWIAVYLSSLWAVVLTCVTFGLAIYRGGVGVDTWFAPMSGRRRAEVTGLTVVTLLGLEVVSSISGANARVVSIDGKSRLREDDPELAPTAEHVRDAWRQLRQTYGVPEMPSVLLRFRRDDRPEPVLTEVLKSGHLIVGVRRDASSHELKRWVVADILTGLTAGHWERVPFVGTWAAGFAAFALNDDSLAKTAARLSDVDPALIDDYDRLRQRLGRRGAEAAGWVAWRALAREGGADSVGVLARALFSSPLRQSGEALVRARWWRPASFLPNVDRAALHEQWRAIVSEHRDAFDARIRWNLPPPRFERPPGLTPRLAWVDLPIDVSAHRVDLWWSVASDLYPHPVPHDRLRAARVEAPTGGYLVFIDPRLRIVTTWVVDGEVQGWAEVVR